MNWMLNQVVNKNLTPAMKLRGFDLDTEAVKSNCWSYTKGREEITVSIGV